MPRILVIDDEADVRELLSSLLTGQGYEVVSAPDGKAAMKLSEGQNIALIITDVFMPEKDGLEVIRHFRRAAPKLPIIVMSGRPDLANVFSIAQRFGAQRQLMKPFECQEVVDMVTDLLRPHEGDTGITVLGS